MGAQSNVSLSPFSTCKYPSSFTSPVESFSMPSYDLATTAGVCTIATGASGCGVGGVDALGNTDGEAWLAGGKAGCVCGGGGGMVAPLAAAGGADKGETEAGGATDEVLLGSIGMYGEFCNDWIHAPPASMHMRHTLLSRIASSRLARISACQSPQHLKQNRFLPLAVL